MALNIQLKQEFASDIAGFNGKSAALGSRTDLDKYLLLGYLSGRADWIAKFTDPPTKQQLIDAGVTLEGVFVPPPAPLPVTPLAGTVWDITKNPKQTLTLTSNRTISVISESGSEGYLLITGNGYYLTLQEGGFSQALQAKATGDTLICYANFSGNREAWIDNAVSNLTEGRGAWWLYGDAAPGGSNWVGIGIGDFYYDRTHKNVYQYQQNGWIYVGTMNGGGGGSSTADGISYEPTNETGWNSLPNNVDKALNDLHARLLAGGGSGGAGVVERVLAKCDFILPDWYGKIEEYKYEAGWKLGDTGGESLFVSEGILQGYPGSDFKKPYLAYECDANNFRLRARLYVPILLGQGRQVTSVKIGNYECELDEQTPRDASVSDTQFEIAVTREENGRKSVFFRETIREEIFMQGEPFDGGSTDWRGDLVDVFLEVRDGRVTAITATDVETGEPLPLDNRPLDDAPTYDLCRGLSFCCYGSTKVGLKSVRIIELLKTV